MTKELNWIDIQYFQLVSTLKEVAFTISCRLQNNPNLNKRKISLPKLMEYKMNRLVLAPLQQRG